MKRFRDFKIDPIVILATPNHGQHSVPKSKKPVVITSQPVHGAHAVRGKLREERERRGSKTISREEWGDRNHNPHLGEDLLAVAAKLQKPHEEWQKHPHTEAVRRYTQGSSALNGRLVDLAKSGKHHHEPTHKMVSPSSPDDIKWDDTKWKAGFKKEANAHRMQKVADVHRLDKAIAHEPLQHDLHVFHGTSAWHPGEEASKHPDRLIKVPTFMSTSIDSDRAHRFSSSDGHILHIHMKKGQKALPILGHSEHPREHEVLLPRDTVLKIHKKPTKLDSGAHVWHAEVHDK